MRRNGCDFGLTTAFDDRNLGYRSSASSVGFSLSPNDYRQSHFPNMILRDESEKFQKNAYLRNGALELMEHSRDQARSIVHLRVPKFSAIDDSFNLRLLELLEHIMSDVRGIFPIV